MHDASPVWRGILTALLALALLAPGAALAEFGDAEPTPEALQEALQEAPVEEAPVEEAPEETPEAAPAYTAETPAALPPTVVLMLSELHACVDDAVDLLDGAVARDETGAAVAVSVKDAGGFDSATAGDYTVVYEALHPVTGASFTASRVVTVLTMEQYRALHEGFDASVHAAYLKKRDAIHAALSELKARFGEQARQRIAAYAQEQGLPEGYTVLQGEYGGKRLAEVQAYEIDNWQDVLTVYVAARCYQIGTPEELFTLYKGYSLERMETVFFDMLDISLFTGGEEGGEPAVAVRSLSAADVLDGNTLDDKRQKRLKRMLEPDFAVVFSALVGDDESITPSARVRRDILDRLPSGLSESRCAVAIAAHALEGRVAYFTGGTHHGPGWNDEWGVPALNDDARSSSYGCLQPYGLDSGGFAAWVFVNAAGGDAVLEQLGASAARQRENAYSIPAERALPGDLMFYDCAGDAEVCRVGVIVGPDGDGGWLVAHCSSEAGTVVIERASRTDFTETRRPHYFGD